MARLSVLIVTHESARCLPECLVSAERWAEEVIVVDNASGDGSADVARTRDGVVVLENATNRGFAAAVNQGFTRSTQPVVLLLNPDAELLDDPQPLADAALTDGYGAAAGLLTSLDGVPQAGFAVRRFPTAAALAFEALGLNRLWPSNPVNRRWRCSDLDLRRDQDVEQPAGAFLAIRREAWQALGGFDESFRPAWFEDVDFCRRLTAAGGRIRLVPEVRARHEGGHSVEAVPWGKRQVFWYVNLLKYAAKHFNAFHRAVVGVSVAASSVFRAIWEVPARRSLEPLSVYATVIGLSLGCVSGFGRGMGNSKVKRNLGGS